VDYTGGSHDYEKVQLSAVYASRQRGRCKVVDTSLMRAAMRWKKTA
jgi:hypothetical protein